MESQGLLRLGSRSQTHWKAKLAACSQTFFVCGCFHILIYIYTCIALFSGVLSTKSPIIGGSFFWCPCIKSPVIILALY